MFFSWNVHTFITFSWHNNTCKAIKAFSYSYRVADKLPGPPKTIFFNLYTYHSQSLRGEDDFPSSSPRRHFYVVIFLSFLLSLQNTDSYE